jgi:hypothetical protein
MGGDTLFNVALWQIATGGAADQAKTGPSGGASGTLDAQLARGGPSVSRAQGAMPFPA